MARGLNRLFWLFVLSGLAIGTQAQERQAEPRKPYIPMTVEDIMLRQTAAAGTPVTRTQKLNDRLSGLKSLSLQPRSYALGPGDVVEVTVLGVPALDRKEFVLDSAGRISLPYVNDVDLLNRTTREAEFGIARLFGESLLENPEVTVSVKAFKSQIFYIFGAVNKPGATQLTGETSLLDALTLAGGLGEKADTHIQIHRAREASAQAPAPLPIQADPPNPAVLLSTADPRSMDIDLVSMLERGDMSLNVPIRSGDVIIVPERQERFIYVIGDVPKPGAYALRKNERMTLSKALAGAGGVLPTAAASKTRIMRPNADGLTTRQMKINATAVIKGEEKDFELAENDVVLVPGSASKTIGRNFMGSLTSIATTLLFIGLY